MKKLFFASIMIAFALVSVKAQNVGVSAYYNVPSFEQDSVLSGLISIRGANYHPDLLGDGVSAIGVTSYPYHTVSVFAAAGNDSIELKWTSPPTPEASGSSPRFVVFGDLDNDGLNEVIFQLAGVGVAVYEWDGVPGSWNFGDTPSQVVNFETLAGASNAGNAEYMEVLDVDGDGNNELLIALNSTPNENDMYYVVSANGNWVTGNPIFSTFNLEASFRRTDLEKWGISGGSPYALIAANFDGVGNHEILLHNWNLKNVVPITVPAADTYQLSDTTNEQQNIFLGDNIDDVALFSGVAADIDGDGREEVYLPTYPGQDGNGDRIHKGWLHMISYNSGESTSEITSQNVTLLDMSAVSGQSQFGIGYGDLDNDGKMNIYVGGGYGINITSAEFQGGDKRDVNNWVFENIYTNSEIYSKITYKDSSGVNDTSYTYNTAFVSKLFAKNTDFDKDGHQDIIMPYQGLNDSTTIMTITWNGSSYDTVSTKIRNPRAWGLRILEADFGTGVKSKEIAIITPKDYKLEQNYPNPFNPTTTIRFSLPVKNNVTLAVYDMLGQEVKTLLANQLFAKGSFEVAWDGTNNFGVKVSSGNYIYTLKFGNFQISKKMTLLK